MKNTKKTFTLAIIIVGCILAIGCWRGLPYFCKSYIQEYILYDGIEVRRATVYSTKYLDIYVNPTKRVSFLSEGADKVLYDEICALAGDTEYNQEVFLPIEDVPAVRSEYPFCTAIDVVSNKDFDAEHPAGTLLNDVMSVRYMSAIPYIESGYTDQEILNKWIEKPLNELQPTDLALNWGNIYLIFNKEPDVLETHGLAFKWTNTEGETFQTGYNYNFALPEGEVEPWTEVTYDTIYNYSVDNK